MAEELVRIAAAGSSRRQRFSQQELAHVFRLVQQRHLCSRRTNLLASVDLPIVMLDSSLRIRPYKTMENKIEGAVLVLIDLPKR